VKIQKIQLVKKNEWYIFQTVQSNLHWFVILCLWKQLHYQFILHLVSEKNTIKNKNIYAHSTLTEKLKAIYSCWNLYKVWWSSKLTVWKILPPFNKIMHSFEPLVYHSEISLFLQGYGTTEVSTF
jgi:hypothetical protein